MTDLMAHFTGVWFLSTNGIQVVGNEIRSNREQIDFSPEI